MMIWHSLNAYLLARCDHLNNRKPPERQTTIAEVFTTESASLRPPGRPFDGYIEKSVKASCTCLVRYDNHHYSVPSVLAGKRVSLRAYADRIVVVNDHTVVAEHPRGFSKQGYHFEPWHYVPLLAGKTACELALEEKTTHLSAIINLIHRLSEANTQTTIDASSYPDLQHPPIANCHRYDQLRSYWLRASHQRGKLLYKN